MNNANYLPKHYFLLGTDELECIHDPHKSFYGKAVYITDGNKLYLKSYNTIVGYINKRTKKAVFYDTYSVTTLRHIREFLAQNGFKTGSKTEIERMYIS
jgi:hypothetical protein